MYLLILPAYQYSKVFMDERGDGNNAETGPNGANLNDSFLNVGGADPEGQDFEDLLNGATFEDHHDDTVRSGGLFYDDGDDDLGPPESPEFPFNKSREKRLQSILYLGHFKAF